MTPEEFFDSQFRYKIEQEVRHKADTKSEFSADMGLLVLHRYIVEEKERDGSSSFKYRYLCRMIKFSGSGGTGEFTEGELMSVDEYEQARIERQERHHNMRERMKELQKEIYDSFEVEKGAMYYLREEGRREFNKTKKYKLVGWTKEKNSVCVKFREMFTFDTLGEDMKEIEVSDPKRIKSCHQETT